MNKYLEAAGGAKLYATLSDPDIAQGYGALATILELADLLHEASTEIDLYKGLLESAQGKTEDLGSFADYATEAPND